MAFQGFRTNGGPTFYEAVFTPWEGDLLTSGLIFCFCILAFSFYLILPGLVGKDILFTFIRITVSLYIGAVILVSNFGQTWETAETHTRTKYKAGTGEEVNVTIGVNIGFRGVNITLKGEANQIKGETINYNENFNWEGVQGRLGFGPFAGRFSREFRAAQFRGLPLPILWIAEYFTLDGEGIRWGRFYRQAGWYSHIILWLAFPLWILSNILFLALLRYGAYFLALTGLAMITSNIIWATYRNPLDLKIPFTAHDVLEFSYGGSFWVCLITDIIFLLTIYISYYPETIPTYAERCCIGIICVLLGIIIFFVDKLWPTHAAVFFGVDVLQDSENILVEEEDEPATVEGRQEDDANDSNGSATYDDELYTPPPPMMSPPVPAAAKAYAIKPAAMRSYRTSEHRLTKRLQRPRRREPPPIPPRFTAEDDDDDYQNAPTKREPKGAAKHVSIGNRQSLAEEVFDNAQPATIEMTDFENY